MTNDPKSPWGWKDIPICDHDDSLRVSSCANRTAEPLSAVLPNEATDTADRTDPTSDRPHTPRGCLGIARGMPKVWRQRASHTTRRWEHNERACLGPTRLHFTEKYGDNEATEYNRNVRFHFGSPCRYAIWPDDFEITRPSGPSTLFASGGRYLHSACARVWMVLVRMYRRVSVWVMT
jgi:hypothetical protein